MKHLPIRMSAFSQLKENVNLHRCYLGIHLNFM